MVKAIDPICTWCKKPDSKCQCETQPVFEEASKLGGNKMPPGVDVTTYLMEILGLTMFYLGFTAFVFVLIASFAISSKTDQPIAIGTAGSLVGFFSTFGIMLSGSIMYLLARINHRLWTT